MDKAELIISALQQRIGELVSNYETQIAIIRADLTQILADNEEKDKTIKEYAESLKEKLKPTNKDKC